MRITANLCREIIYFPILFYRDSLSCWRSAGRMLVGSEVSRPPESVFERRAHYCQNPPKAGIVIFLWWDNMTSVFPYLGAELVCLHLGLLFEPVVSVVVSEGIFDEGRKHKHVADPEVDVQCLDGWRPRQGGASAHHQGSHGENGCDPCWKKTDLDLKLRYWVFEALTWRTGCPNALKK